MTGPSPRALFFDVFGTCVDWRTSVIDEIGALAARRGLTGLDPAAVADAWRGRYQPQLETVRSGARPWVDLDVLHREALDDVLADHGVAPGDVPEAERAELTRVWHRLDPWPDVVAGLARLKARFVIAPCSNAHIALVLAMAKRAGLAWDVILGGEIARAYKPQPEVYLRSVAAAGFEPGDVMMVAAHNHDIGGAKACGLRTCFVPRPREHGPAQRTDLAPEHDPDLVAEDFGALASALGA